MLLDFVEIAGHWKWNITIGQWKIKLVRNLYTETHRLGSISKCRSYIQGHKSIVLLHNAKVTFSFDPGNQIGTNKSLCLKL